MIEIPVGKNHVALIDDEDLDLVKDYLWCIRNEDKRLYARSSAKRANGRRDTIAMHRVIMGAKTGQMIDHINGNGLDNRRCNLRFVDDRRNQYNARKFFGSSKRKGVSWREEQRKYVAKIRDGEKQRHLGSFTSETEAALAYDWAAINSFGEYACTNFPPELVRELMVLREESQALAQQRERMEKALRVLERIANEDFSNPIIGETSMGIARKALAEFDAERGEG